MLQSNVPSLAGIANTNDGSPLAAKYNTGHVCGELPVQQSSQLLAKWSVTQIR